MPKRKRSDFVVSETPNDVEANQIESARSIAIQQKTIEQKIYHHRIVLKRALKTAKGFEQQKLGKRLKAARKGKGPGAKHKDVKDEVERLEKELDALKDIDLTDLATTYLNKTLLKSRQLSTSKYFPLSVAKEAEEHLKLSAPSGPIANVCARLLNANPVKEAMKEITGNLAQILGIAEGIDTLYSKSAKEDGEAKTMLEPSKKVIITGKVDDNTNMNKDIVSEPEDEEVLDTYDDIVHPSMLKQLATKYLNDRGSISSDEDEESDLDERIVVTSEDEGVGVGDENEEQQEEGHPRGRSMSITPIPDDQIQEVEESDEGEDIDSQISISISPPPKKQKSSKPTTSAQPTGPIKSSSFLPSLMSGYISASDSDASSLSDGNTGNKRKKGPLEKKIRKNRMGQQARRALAEKKYGVQANHIKKEKEDKEAKKKQKEERQRAWEEKQSKAVHVSWQLKKKDKEEKDRIVRSMMAGVGEKTMGKKIVFD